MYSIWELKLTTEGFIILAAAAQSGDAWRQETACEGVGMLHSETGEYA